MNKVIVLIPHFNNVEGLKKSINSINEKENVDILIVDDGSVVEKINEKEILKEFKANGIIHFFYLKENQGIEHALNSGLQELIDKDYKYIARLDAGDLCLNMRFKKQFEFLEQYENIGLIGSNVIITDIKGNLLFRLKVPTDSNLIKNKMFVSSTVIHPTIMFRKEIVSNIGFYPTNFKAAEDYAYYFEILKKYNFSNINEYLLEKELNPNSISIKNRKKQALNRVKIIIKNFYFGYYPIIGLIWNFILYITPNNLIINTKKVIFKK